MSLFLRRSVRRYSSNPYAFAYSTPAFEGPLLNTNFSSGSDQFSSVAIVNHFQPQFPTTALSSAAERRRCKRGLWIEPPPYALPPNPPPVDLDRPRLPDTVSALVGPRLDLHDHVRSLILAGDLDAASYVARQSVFQGVRPTVFTCNDIIEAMCVSKRYQDSIALFHYFFRQLDVVPDSFSYDNLIVSYCESNQIEEALQVHKEIMAIDLFGPSSVAYRHLTKGLIAVGRIEVAVSFLREILYLGGAADSLVFNNVILGFLNLGRLDKANELFDELKDRCPMFDWAVCATFMDWFFKQGRDKEAMEFYGDSMARDYQMVPATRNVLLETLLKHGKMKEAWTLFHAMLDDHTPPTFEAVNSDTINMMVNLCFNEGNVEEAIDVFRRSGKGPQSKPFSVDVAGYNNMLMRLCELDMMDEADQYYKQLLEMSLVPDVDTFKILIDAYIKLDMVDRVIEKYSEMVELRLRVIPAYANKWFGFMIQKGKASDCLPILSKMCDRGAKLDVMTYDIVIRGLVQEGCFDATANVLRKMMTRGIGTTPLLKEFVLGAFSGLGLQVEIENILKIVKHGIPPASPAQMSYANQHTQQSYANQHTQQSYPHQHMQQSANRQSQQSYANQHRQESYANQFIHQRSQPQMTQEMAHSHTMPLKGG